MGIMIHISAHFKQTDFYCSLDLFQENGDSNCKIHLSVHLPICNLLISYMYKTKWQFTQISEYNGAPPLKRETVLSSSKILAFCVLINM